MKNAGWTVLFRGTGITMARAFPVNAVTFLIYSQLKEYLDEKFPPSFKRETPDYSDTSSNDSR